jgi:hypothetical protein
MSFGNHDEHPAPTFGDTLEEHKVKRKPWGEHAT